jgi:hypothetical protein
MLASVMSSPTSLHGVSMADYRMTIDELFDAARAKKMAYLQSLDLPLDQRPRVEPCKPFANPTHEHAGQVITKLVRETLHELVILGRNLATTGHSALRMRAHLQRFPNARIRILVEGSRTGPIYPNGHIRWSALRGSALVDLVLDSHAAGDDVLSRDGEVRDGHIAIRVLPVASPTHFVVSDGVAYRIEQDHEVGEASANAFDPPQANQLLKKFDRFWKLSAAARLPVLHRSAA